MKVHTENFPFIIIGYIGLHRQQIFYITTKSVSSVALLGITIDSKLNFKEDINNIIKKAYYKLYIYPKTTMKVSKIRKSQNLSLFNDRNSICLLPVNLDVLLKNRYAKSWKGTINIKLHKWCITITWLNMMKS